jgi:hypothetical protein
LVLTGWTEVHEALRTNEEAMAEHKGHARHDGGRRRLLSPPRGPGSLRPLPAAINKESVLMVRVLAAIGTKPTSADLVVAAAVARPAADTRRVGERWEVWKRRAGSCCGDQP